MNSHAPHNLPLGSELACPLRRYSNGSMIFEISHRQGWRPGGRSLQEAQAETSWLDHPFLLSLRENRLIANLVASVLFIAGLAITPDNAKTFMEALRSTHWPHTEGQIVSSKMASRHRSRGGLAHGRTGYGPKILYEYKVNGNTYTSNRIHFVRTFSSMSSASRRLSEYPVGKQVLVYYNPHEASKAVLEPGLSLSAGSPLFLGLLMILLCSMAFFIVNGYPIEENDSSEEETEP